MIPISHGKTSLELNAGLNDTGTRFKCVPTTTTLFSEPFCMALESLLANYKIPLSKIRGPNRILRQS